MGNLMAAYLPAIFSNVLLQIGQRESSLFGLRVLYGEPEGKAS